MEGQSRTLIIVVVLSCYFWSVLSNGTGDCSYTKDNQKEVKGVLNGSFTVSPYNNLLPLQPSEWNDYSAITTPHPL